MGEQQAYVDAWTDTVDRLTGLLDGLTDDAWGLPTDCPGWDVRAVVAHLVHLEEAVASGVTEPVDTERRVLGPRFTEPGVDELRQREPAELRARLHAAVADRRGQLAALPELDLAERPDRTPFGVAWDHRTLLRNRAIDVWVHEQDVRRAVGQPGGLDSPGAAVTVATFASALPVLLARRAGVDDGTVVRWVVEGPHGFAAAYAVDAGRAEPSDADPHATLTMDTETFTVLGAGRRSTAEAGVTVDGDPDLGGRVLAVLAMTP